MAYVGYTYNDGTGDPEAAVTMSAKRAQMHSWPQFQSVFTPHPSVEPVGWWRGLYRLLHPRSCYDWVRTLFVVLALMFGGSFVAWQCWPTWDVSAVTPYQESDYRKGITANVVEVLEKFAVDEKHGCYMASDVGRAYSHVMLLRNLTADLVTSHTSRTPTSPVNPDASDRSRVVVEVAPWERSIDKSIREARSVTFLHMSNMEIVASNVTVTASRFPTEAHELVQAPVSCLWLSPLQRRQHNLALFPQYYEVFLPESGVGKMRKSKGDLVGGGPRPTKGSPEAARAELAAVWVDRHHGHAEVTRGKYTLSNAAQYGLKVKFYDHVQVTYDDLTIDPWNPPRKRTSLFGTEAFCLQHFELLRRNRMFCYEDSMV